MLIQAALRGLVVIRGDEQQCIRAVALRILREHDRGLGGVAAGAGNDRNAVRGHFHCEADDLAVLLLGERRAFAGRSGDDKCVCAVLDLIVDQSPELIIIHGAVCMEWCHKRNGSTGKNRRLHSQTILSVMYQIEYAGNCAASQPRSNAVSSSVNPRISASSLCSLHLTISRSP